MGIHGLKTNLTARPSLRRLRRSVLNGENTKWALYGLALAAVAVASLAYGCGLDGGDGVDGGGATATVPGPVSSAEGAGGTSVATATDAPTEESTVTAMTPTNGTGMAPVISPGGNDAPPSGNRAEWPAETQAREKAVLFALAASPWPSELHAQVLSVSFCESSWRPGAENGISYGLLQLTPLWFTYYGVLFSGWADIHVNLALAWQVYNYDLERGQAPWNQWSCKPT